jgi:hypothetical protein
MCALVGGGDGEEGRERKGKEIGMLKECWIGNVP